MTSPTTVRLTHSQGIGLRHNVSAAAFSNDKRGIIAVGGENDQISFFVPSSSSSSSGGSVCIFQGPTEKDGRWITSMAFSPIDPAVFVAASGTKVTVFSFSAAEDNCAVEGPVVVSTLEHDSEVLSLAFDGKLLATRSSSKDIRIWSAAAAAAAQEGEQQKKWRCRSKIVLNDAQCVMSIVFSPDSRHLLCACGWDGVRTVDVKSGEELQDRRIVFMKVSNPDAAKHGKDDIRSKTKHMALHVVFIDESRILISGYKHMVVHDVRTGRPLQQALKGHTQVLGNAHIAFDKGYVVSSALDLRMLVWRLSDADAESASASSCSVSAAKPIQAVRCGGLSAASSDGRSIVTFNDGNPSPQLELYRLRRFELDDNYVASAQAALFAWRSLHPGEKFSVGTGGNHMTEKQLIEAMFLSEYHRPKYSLTVPRRTQKLLSAALDPDPDRRPSLQQIVSAAAAAAAAASVSLGDDSQLQQVRLEKVVEINAGQMVTAAALSGAANNIIATAGRDGFLALWDCAVASGPTQICTLVGHEKDIRCLAFSRSGTRLISCSQQDTILWSVSTAEPSCCCCTPLARVVHQAGHEVFSAVAFSPADDDVWVTGGLGENGLCFWTFSAAAAAAAEASTMKCSRRIKVSPGWTTSVDIARDGSKVLVCCGNGSFHILDMKSGERLVETRALGRGYCAGFSPDAARFVCAEQDRISIRDAATGEALATMDRAEDKDANTVGFLQENNVFFSQCDEAALWLWSLSRDEDGTGGGGGGGEVELMQVQRTEPTHACVGGPLHDTVLCFRGLNEKRVGVFIAGRFALDAAYRSSCEKAIAIILALHQGCSGSGSGQVKDPLGGLGSSLEEICTQMFHFPSKRPHFHPALPAGVVDMLLSAFDQDPAKRPSRDSLDQLATVAPQLRAAFVVGVRENHPRLAEIGSVAKSIGCTVPPVVAMENCSWAGKIGQGGFASVTAAIIPKLSRSNRVLAVKDFHSDVPVDERIKEVARSFCISSPKSPNPFLVTTLGIVLDNRSGGEDTVMLVMHKAESSLLKWMMSPPDGSSGFRRLSRFEVFDLAYQMAQGLSELHGKNFIHLDLSPNNILVSTFPRSSNVRLQLTDFGNGHLKAGGTGAGGTKTELSRDLLAATLRWACPEQRGQIGAASTTAARATVNATFDTFAFGTIVLWLLTSTLPELCVATNRKRLQEAIAVPAPLKQLVAQCLGDDSSQRPKNGAALVRALDEMLRDEANMALFAVLNEETLLGVLLVNENDDGDDDADGQLSAAEARAISGSSMAMSNSSFGTRIEGDEIIAGVSMTGDFMQTTYQAGVSVLSMLQHPAGSGLVDAASVGSSTAISPMTSANSSHLTQHQQQQQQQQHQGQQSLQKNTADPMVMVMPHAPVEENERVCRQLIESQVSGFFNGVGAALKLYFE